MMFKGNELSLGSESFVGAFCKYFSLPFISSFETDLDAAFLLLSSLSVDLLSSARRGFMNAQSISKFHVCCEFSAE